MFGSAKPRREAFRAAPAGPTCGRDASKSIAFGAGPHFCAGALASRAMVADAALPAIFSRLKDLRLNEDRPPRDRRLGPHGPLILPVTWIGRARRKHQPFIVSKQQHR